MSSRCHFNVALSQTDLHAVRSSFRMICFDSRSMWLCLPHKHGFPLFRNSLQVFGIPCFGKSIDFQWDLFRQSIAGVGNSISWQFPWVLRGTYLNRCGKLLVSANPLTFNGICFNKAYSIGNNFISLFFTGSLFLL